MQEYRKTATDNKTAFGFLPFLAESNKTGWVQMRILTEKKYYGKGKSQNEELFGLDWNGDLDCAVCVVGADVMEVIEVLRGQAKSLRDGKGIAMNPAVANASVKMSSTKDGVKVEISRVVTREVQPTEDEVKAYKNALKAAAAKSGGKKGKKGDAKGDTPAPEAPKPKRVTDTFKREFSLTRYEAAAIAVSLEGTMQYIMFG